MHRGRARHREPQCGAHRLRNREAPGQDDRRGPMMPILKDIAGHGGTAGIRRYLEKGNRALARDVMNLPMEEWVGEAPGEHSIIAEWDVEMDRTREAYGTNAPLARPGCQDVRALRHLARSRRWHRFGCVASAFPRLGGEELQVLRGGHRLPRRQREGNPACTHRRQQRESQDRLPLPHK